MIRELSTSIIDKFNDPDGLILRTALTGGLWFMEAPESTSYPYGVYTWDGSNVEEICGGQDQRIETASISVSLFSKNDDGGAEVFDISEKFMKLFDWCTLVFPAGKYEHIAFSRQSIIQRGKSDGVWVIDINYEAQYEH